MYLPKSFQIEDLAELQAFIHAYNFASLVTQHEGAPFASHLPFMLDAERGHYGTLLAHMARANPQWRDFATGGEALVIFQGPHAYISPSWYETHPSVPTWNYAVVHAYGVARIVEDHTTLRSMLERLVDTHEAAFAQPWRMDLPHNYLDKMMRAVVGFEIEITRLEGKLKLSQNRSEHDQHQVAEALAQSENALDRGVAELMVSAKA
ncbi:MAG: FMN-binding negative transcriptional regulator [Chloroflexota bacterium]|nr:FMN-binding negative transcriptional regulator [Chloroflexota bacterium]